MFESHSMFSRRNALRAGATVAGATALGAVELPRAAALTPDARRGNTAFHASKCPAAAKAAGYTRLAFSDDFDSYDTFDLGYTGRAGYNWYLDLPFGWGQTPKSWLDINKSILTLNQDRYTANWAISSVDPVTGIGSSFKFGYFEALGRFDPTIGGKNSGFPAWWSLSTEHTVQNDPSVYAELDFFEAYVGVGEPYSGAYVTTLHEWSTIPGNQYHYQGSNNWHLLGTDYTQWHKFGCLWQPGKVSWYCDDTLITSTTYGKDRYPDPATSRPADHAGIFSILDEEKFGMNVILGTGVDYPFELDWVKVWA